MFTLKISETETTKQFDSIENAREYVKSIYEYKNMDGSFYKNYTIAELYQPFGDKDIHIEDYVGRGMETEKGNIQIWSRDRYNMWKCDFEWRVKEIINA